MAYLLDENLSRKLANILADAFTDVSHVANESMLSSDDMAVWKFAKTNSRIIITKDHDFFDMSQLYGCPPKVIKLNCGNKSTNQIGSLLLAHATTISDFAVSENCYMEIL